VRCPAAPGHHLDGNARHRGAGLVRRVRVCRGAHRARAAHRQGDRTRCGPAGLAGHGGRRRGADPRSSRRADRGVRKAQRHVSRRKKRASGTVRDGAMIPRPAPRCPAPRCPAPVVQIHAAAIRRPRTPVGPALVAVPRACDAASSVNLVTVPALLGAGAKPRVPEWRRVQWTHLPTKERPCSAC
jgi:hypothetical protein